MGVADASGGQTQEWLDVSMCFAQISPISGREQLKGDQIESPLTHRVTIRYRAGLLPKMRVVYGARLFNIRAIKNLEERNVWLELMCEEGVGI
jgi:SPP1 family predicted phage head-tail adaptor